MVWRKKVASKLIGHSFTNALTYYDGKLLTGSSGGDAGAPAFVIAMDAKTGRTLWRFNVIPQKRSDPGWNTWPAKRAFNGGGAMWNQLTVDPALGLVYGVTGNPIPYSGVKRGSGQELFTESIIALNVNTGKLRWYNQLIHHDIWDYDATNATILYDRGSFKGIAHAGKTGWVYAFDRRTGKSVSGLHEVKVPQAPRSNTYPTQPMQGDWRQVLAAVSAEVRFRRQVPDGAGREAVQAHRMHLRAVRRHRVHPDDAVCARRRQLAALLLQPRHRVNVHLLEGQLHEPQVAPGGEAEARGAR